jgi:hypothetical protein
LSDLRGGSVGDGAGVRAPPQPKLVEGRGVSRASTWSASADGLIFGTLLSFTEKIIQVETQLIAEDGQHLVVFLLLGILARGLELLEARVDKSQQAWRS